MPKAMEVWHQEKRLMPKESLSLGELVPTLRARIPGRMVRVPTLRARIPGRMVRVPTQKENTPIHLVKGLMPKADTLLLALI
jgi:hypothetical protein